MSDTTRRIWRIAAPFALATLVMVVQEQWGAPYMAGWRWSPPRVLGLTPEPSGDSSALAGDTAVAVQEETDGSTVSRMASNADSASPALDSTVAASDSMDLASANAEPSSAASVHGHLTVPRGGLASVMTALDSLQRNLVPVVRIAHYGDSQIEGDRFTMYLRRALQEPFGGYGVGFVPIMSEVAKFRVTVRHTFSNNWKQRDRKGPGPWQYGTGPGGLQFLPGMNAPSTASYQTVGPLASLAIGLAPSTEPMQLQVVFGPTDSSSIAVPSHPTDTVVVIRPTTNTRNAALSVRGTSAVYGVWLQENRRGLAVDNYSRRGSAGDHLLDVAGCAAERSPTVGSTRLVILMFGINVLTDTPASYGWYGTRLRAVMSTLRRCFPAASMLVMGPALRGVRDPLGVRESRGLAPLARALRQAAIAEGAAFWDQTAAMRQIAPFSAWATNGMLSPDLAHYSDGASRQLGRQLAADLLQAFRAESPTGSAGAPGS